MNNNNISIVLIERIFPSYRKPIYNEVHKKRPFLFLHSVMPQSGIKQVDSEYSKKINHIQYGKKDSSVILFCLRQLIKIRPKIIIHEFSAGIISIIGVLIFARIMGTKLIFWGHMFNRTNGFNPQKNYIDKYRLWLWKMADGLIAYSYGEKELLLKHGIPSQKIFVAPNTLNTPLLLKYRDEMDLKGKAAIKKELGFNEDFNIIYIGRLYKDKLPEVLIDALLELRIRGIKSLKLHFVGDGDQLNNLRDLVNTHQLQDYVSFFGAVYDDLYTGRLLYASDLMIMPGSVGLSVNQAFCFNCPVVTFEGNDGLGPAHGPEIEYVINGKTGFQIPNQSLIQLVDTVEKYFNSSDLQTEMKLSIKDFIENKCSLEKMTSGVIDAIEFNLN